MNNGLVPEQRPDKNGNIVTRWVRGMFSSDKPRRVIPNVTIGGALKSIKNPEINGMYRRLMSEMPTGTDAELLAEYGASGIKILNARRTIMDAYTRGDGEVLSLLEQFGDTEKCYAISESARILRAYSENPRSLNEEKVAAYEAVHDALMLASVTALGPEKFGAQPFTPRDERPLMIHVLKHPEDTALAVSILNRGVHDESEVLRVMRDKKKDEISNPVSDGFL